MSNLEALYEQKAAKFSEMCRLLTKELHYGDFSALSKEGRKNVEDEIEQLVQDWHEAVEMQIVPAQPDTSLHRLLRDHYEICETILDQKRDEAGLA